MLSQRDTIKLGGYLLNRTIMTPPIGTPIIAAAIVTHGQGDFSERYINVLKPFTDRGIMCICTDLLGHGRSPGRRGHGGTLEQVDAIFQTNLDYIGNLPYGIIGHSMGGLLSLRHCVIAQRGGFPLPNFAWISSALLSPTQDKPDWFVKLAMACANIAPRITIGTGITPEMCRTAPEVNSNPKNLRSQLGHRRISLGWAKEIIQAHQLVSSSFPELNYPILYTQGESDTVCPPQKARAFCKQHPNIDYREFAGMLHEPFDDVGSELLFKAISQWLDTHVTAQALAKH